MEPKKVVYSDRTEYFFNSVRHRTTGPAVEWNNGNEEWLINGKYHREDGPAIFWNGNQYWVINGKNITGDVEQWFSDTGFNPNYEDWTTQEQFEFKLRWG